MQFMVMILYMIIGSNIGIWVVIDNCFAILIILIYSLLCLDTRPV